MRQTTLKRRATAGVDPYQAGRHAETEDIEAGEQREETHIGMSKAEAIERGRQFQRRMGHRWRLIVWQNLGWHYMLRRGPLQLHVYRYRGRTTYSCLMSDEPNGIGGFSAWTEPGASYKTASAAVKAQLDRAQAVVDRLQAALDEAS